jgi:hypothetical protein
MWRTVFHENNCGSTKFPYLFIYLILATKQRCHPNEICTRKQRIQRKFIRPIPSALRMCAVRKSSGAGEPPYSKEKVKGKRNEHR